MSASANIAAMKCCSGEFAAAPLALQAACQHISWLQPCCPAGRDERYEMQGTCRVLVSAHLGCVLGFDFGGVLSFGLRNGIVGRFARGGLLGLPRLRLLQLDVRSSHSGVSVKCCQSFNRVNAYGLSRSTCSTCQVFALQLQLCKSRCLN